MSDDPLLASLLAALEHRPEDGVLRRHVVEQLLIAGRPTQALAQVSRLLAESPGDPAALALLQRVTTAMTSPAGEQAGEQAGERAAEPPTETPADDGFDWASVEQEFQGVDHPMAEPAFVSSGDGDDEADDPLAGFDIDRPSLRLVDVGGMADTKRRLDVAFLTPMRNPELRKAFGKSLRGGLLLYGPPGCGKTFIARALAGELGARFASVSLADVLDMWVGSSERNLHQLFLAARRAAPCVVFLDEIDALGHKRSELRGAQRGTVNQLLTELDGVGADNEGVFVLAASNAPWDIDAALRRPGRLDRTLLVLPPDPPARAEILRYHLSRRPIAGIDLEKLARRTEHYSGADLAHVVETAAERALDASVASGAVRPITMRDLLAACGEVKPSTGPWFDTARNVAEFANSSGEYDDLVEYLKKRRML